MSTKKNTLATSKSVALNDKLKKRAILGLIGSIILLLIALGILINIIIKVRKDYNTPHSIEIITSPDINSTTILKQNTPSISHSSNTKASHPMANNKVIQVITPITPVKKVLATNKITTIIAVKPKSNTTTPNIKAILNATTIHKLAINPTPTQLLNNAKIASYILVYTKAAKLDVAKALQHTLKNYKINTLITKVNNSYQLQSINRYFKEEAQITLTKYKEQYNND